MKATGIVRRIDDLGRVVIPKEIRRTLRIREGEPLEIFTEKDGEVIFKKYSPLGDISAFSAQCAESLNKSGGYSIIICDNDNIVATAGVQKREYIEKPISPSLAALLARRKDFAATAQSGGVEIIDGADGRVSYLSPIISEGDILGAVMSVMQNGMPPSEIEQKLIATGALFLGKQTEI